MTLLQRPDMKGFVAAIFAMGVLRFILSISGVPNSVVTYFSMSAVILVATVYFAFTTQTHKERLKAAWILILPYMIIELAALGYTWATGAQTIFHTEQTSLGFSIAQHTIGHLVGGLTWEPLSVFIAMEIVWGIRALLRKATG